MSSTAVPAERRVARPNGWWGIAVFVATEATLFGTIVASYFYLRFRAEHWPPLGTPEPKLTLPLVLTGVLVATTLPVGFALSAARRGRAAPAWAALVVALVVQAGYFAMQLHLFLDDLHKFDPGESSYGSIYFTLLGAHHAHVAAGMLLELWLLARLVTGVTRYRLVALEATAFYWYFVNTLALVVVGVQLSAAA